MTVRATLTTLWGNCFESSSLLLACDFTTDTGLSCWSISYDELWSSSTRIHILMCLVPTRIHILTKSQPAKRQPLRENFYLNIIYYFVLWLTQWEHSQECPKHSYSKSAMTMIWSPSLSWIFFCLWGESSKLPLPLRIPIAHTHKKNSKLPLSLRIPIAHQNSHKYST